MVRDTIQIIKQQTYLESKSITNIEKKRLACFKFNTTSFMGKTLLPFKELILLLRESMNE